MSKFNILATVSMFSICISQANAIKFDLNDPLSEKNENQAHKLYRGALDALEREKSEKLLTDKEEDEKWKSYKEYIAKEKESLEKERKQAQIGFDSKKNEIYESAESLKPAPYKTSEKSLTNHELDERWQPHRTYVATQKEALKEEKKKAQKGFEDREKEIYKSAESLKPAPSDRLWVPTLGIKFRELADIKVSSQHLFNIINAAKRRNAGKKIGTKEVGIEEAKIELANMNLFLQKFEDKVIDGLIERGGEGAKLFNMTPVEVFTVEPTDVLSLTPEPVKINHTNDMLKVEESIIPNKTQELVEINSERLTDLSIPDMEATLGDSMEYSMKAKSLFPDMHRHGDEWPDEKLQDTFLEGLFQHYTYQFTGFHYSQDNCMYENAAKDEKLSLWHARVFEELYTKNDLSLPWAPLPTHENWLAKKLELKLPSSENIHGALSVARWFKSVADALKKNEGFKRLGGDFQKYKVKIEKLQKSLWESTETSSVKEEKQRHLYAEDRREMDRQVLLFNWVKDSYAKASQILKETFVKDKMVPNEQHPFIEEVKHFYPEYLYRPVYKALVKDLPEKKM